MHKPIRALLIGAGARGAQSYAPYALDHPEQIVFVGVAEPRAFLRDAFVRQHSIAPEFVFENYEEALAGETFADCVLVCTQDNDHIRPCMLALDAGYTDILVEKPISKNIAECIALRDKAAEKNARILVCHSLRYTAFYNKMRELVQSGTIGTLCAMTQQEGVGYFHQAHSFVRGDWGSSEKSSPMLLAKCCHDTDLILFLSGRSACSVSSIGSLGHFKRENAPKGSPDRCIHGCPAADTCPYNAVTGYQQYEHFCRMAVEKEGFSSFEEAMREGRYGRCAYKCENDVVDRQLVSLLLEDGVTASLVMTAFSKDGGRETSLFGSHGELCGRMEDGVITHRDFATNNVTTYQVNNNLSGHMGADDNMIKALIAMTRTKVKSISDISVSVESHLICHLAEEARHSQCVLPVSL